MKTLKKLILGFIAVITAAAACPALADVPGIPIPILYNSETWVLCLAIGVFAIAAAVLIVLIIRARKKK